MAILSLILSPVGRWVAGGLVVVALLGSIYGKGYFDGKAVVQAKWDAAVQAAIKRGTDARTDAEREIGNTEIDTNDPFLRKDDK